VWEDKIHDILLDKSRVTVGQVAIDGLAFETPAPPAFVDMPFEIYDVRKVGTVRDGLLFQQGKSSRAGASPINPSNAGNRSRRARTKARFACSHELDTTHLRPVTRHHASYSWAYCFLESVGSFPIIDQGHGDRLAGYGVSERLRERQRCTSFEHFRHGNPIWPAFRLRRSPRLKCDLWRSE